MRSSSCVKNIFSRKGNSVLPKLPRLKSLAFHRHRFLPISFVRNCKRTITTYFYTIIHIFFSQIKRQPNSGCLLVYLFILRQEWFERVAWAISIYRINNIHRIKSVVKFINKNTLPNLIAYSRLHMSVV